MDNYVAGVSWPRSGHHLLVRVLQSYFGKDFNYCGFYFDTEDCCRLFPCLRAGRVNLSKNHDRDLKLPQLPGLDYLIQYREFVPSVISDFELHIQNTGKDSPDEFRKYVERQFKIYNKFVEKWVDSVFAKNNTIVKYEDLVADPYTTLEQVVRLFQPSQPVDQPALRNAIKLANHVTVEKTETVIKEGIGVSDLRKVEQFRYYDEAFLRQFTRALEEKADREPLKSQPVQLARPTPQATATILERELERPVTSANLPTQTAREPRPDRSAKSRIKAHLTTIREFTRTRLSIEELRRKFDALQSEIGSLSGMLLEFYSLQREVRRLSNEKAGMEQTIWALRSEMNQIRNAVNHFDGSEHSKSQLAAAATSGPVHVDPDFFNHFYRGFEDRFRGSFEEILGRAREYEPHIRFLRERQYPKSVDLGCGRGEWLEFMREQGFDAVGVDNNKEQTAQAVEKGFTIFPDSILDWLRSCPDSEYDLVTAFHVVEHFDFPDVISILREAHRILRPDGRIILETPNPENHVVGAHTFWLDPTHVRPYPPGTLEQMITSLAFKEVEIHRWERSRPHGEMDARHDLPPEIKQMFDAAQDYSVTAVRP